MVKKFNPSITDLDLTSNKLTSLPSELSQLKYLRTVRVKYNLLTEVPLVLCELEQCMILDLAGNQITDVPSDITRLKQLRELDLSGNRILTLTGAQPPILIPVWSPRLFCIGAGMLARSVIATRCRAGQHHTCSSPCSGA